MKNITWNPAVEVTTHAGTKEVGSESISLSL